MASPFLFGGLFATGAAHALGPAVIEKVIESQSEVNDAESIMNRTNDANVKARRLMDSMRSNAEAIRLLKKQGLN